MSYDMDSAEMMGLIGPQNPKLTKQLVQRKVEWKALQTMYRSNSRGRFLYSITLSKIVHYVDSQLEDHPEYLMLAHDILRWEQECENVILPEQQPQQQQQRFLLQEKEREVGVSADNVGVDTKNNTDNIAITPPASLASTSTSSTLTSSQPHYNPGLKMLLDHRDFQPFLREDIIDMVSVSSSNDRNNHHSNPYRDRPSRNAIIVQNRTLRNEIAKFQLSTKRIKDAILIEVQDLLCHQITLRKVIDRIQLEGGNVYGSGGGGDDNKNNHDNDNDNENKNDNNNSQQQKLLVDSVLRWYDECQLEAKRCGSMSEDAAIEYIRNHLKDDDNNTIDNTNRTATTTNNNHMTNEDVKKVVRTRQMSSRTMGSSPYSPLVQAVVDDYTPFFVVPSSSLPSRITTPSMADTEDDDTTTSVTVSSSSILTSTTPQQQKGHNHRNTSFKNDPLGRCPEQSIKNNNSHKKTTTGSSSKPHDQEGKCLGCTVM
jgi:hypothetical protein